MTTAMTHANKVKLLVDQASSGFTMYVGINVGFVFLWIKFSTCHVCVFILFWGVDFFTTVSYVIVAFLCHWLVFFLLVSNINFLIWRCIVMTPRPGLAI